MKYDKDIKIIKKGMDSLFKLIFIENQKTKISLIETGIDEMIY